MNKVVIGSGQELRIDKRRVGYRGRCFVFNSRGLHRCSMGNGKKMQKKSNSQS